MRDEEKAVELFMRSSDQGNPMAHVHLAYCYESGSGGLPVDHKKSSQLYLKAAELGFAEGQVNGGILLQHGLHGVEKDEVAAVKYFHLAAEQGHPRGMFQLGYAYEHGLGNLERNTETAITWYLKSAELGDSEAQMHVARAYIYGFGGFGVDGEKALALLNDAVLNGNLTALELIGDIYFHGLAQQPKDLKKAFDFYHRYAMESGDVTATGVALLKAWMMGLPSLSVSEMEEKEFSSGDVIAVDLFRSAADVGIPRGFSYLGLAYENGFGGLMVDREKAVELYRRAVAEDDPSGCAHLAVTLLKECGLVIDEQGDQGQSKEEMIIHDRDRLVQAINLLRRASDGDNPVGHAFLGMVHEYGWGGCEKDIRTALFLYKRAADLQDPTGEVQLGLAFERGLGGLQKEKSISLELFSRAAKQGYKEGVENLRRLRDSME
eukprot:TRINITY_DN15060_c0_g6_i1.p1 TRINITY_DN15060_c0_g6~~TRINITY_DN15060_c0_g6_i1.p1  ORF type:complete len:510 (-),score=160.65 TRINITY_DN15060_c0_g6_i1:59-1363(-)